MELKALTPHLRYVVLGRDKSMSIIIVSDLNVQQVECLEELLKGFKRAIGWIIKDTFGIPPVFVHKKSNSCPITSQVLSTIDG